MNAPSTTSLASLAGGAVPVMFFLLAIFFPEAYERTKEYPGAEAMLAGFLSTLVGFLVAWKVKERRYQMTERQE